MKKKKTQKKKETSTGLKSMDRMGISLLTNQRMLVASPLGKSGIKCHYEISGTLHMQRISIFCDVKK